MILRWRRGKIKGGFQKPRGHRASPNRVKNMSLGFVIIPIVSGRKGACGMTGEPKVLEEYEKDLPEELKGLLDKGRRAIRANKRYLALTRKPKEQPCRGSAFGDKPPAFRTNG